MTFSNKHLVYTTYNAWTNKFRSSALLGLFTSPKIYNIIHRTVQFALWINCTIRFEIFPVNKIYVLALNLPCLLQSRPILSIIILKINANSILNSKYLFFECFFTFSTDSHLLFIKYIFMWAGQICQKKDWSRSPYSNLPLLHSCQDIRSIYVKFIISAYGTE